MFVYLPALHGRKPVDILHFEQGWGVGVDGRSTLQQLGNWHYCQTSRAGLLEPLSLCHQVTGHNQV